MFDKKKIFKMQKKLLNLQFSHNTFYFIFFSIVFVANFILFTNFGDLILSESFPRFIDLTANDSGSYRFFKFNNLEAFFTQYRTFGLPLILKLYLKFDPDMNMWPILTFNFFSISIFLMLRVFLKNNFNKIFSLVFCFATLFSYNLWEFAFGWTELWSISFLNLSIAMMILCIKKDSFIYTIAFACLLFFSYIIRPSMVLFIIIPIFFSFFYFFKKKKLKSFKFFFSTTFPLIIFLLVKFSITNDFSIVNFNGIQLSGHAGYYLNENVIKKMKNNENIYWAKLIYEKNIKLSEPCNTLHMINNKNDNLRQYCWNIYLMTAWLTITENTKKKSPYPLDDPRNIEPWQHANLDHFFGKLGSFQKENDIMNKMNIEILKINIKDYLYWIPKSFLLNHVVLINHPAKKIMLFLFILIFVVILFIDKKYFERVEQKIDNNTNENLLVFSIIIVWVTSNLIFAILHLPNQRTIGVQGVYIIPTIFAFLAMIVYKKKQ